MNRYFTPINPRTGELHQQPQPSATQSGWYFDANCEYQYTGFIDAPDVVPTGAHRALDFTEFSIGLAHGHRPGMLA